MKHNDRLENQLNMLEEINTDFKEYYETREEAENRLAELKKQVDVTSSQINEGIFNVTQTVTKEEVVEGNAEALINKLKKALEKEGYIFVKSSVEKQEIKEIKSSEIIEKDAVELTGKTEEEVNKKASEFIEKLDKANLDVSNYDYVLNYDYNVKPICSCEAKNFNYKNIYSTENEAMQYIND